MDIPEEIPDDEDPVNTKANSTQECHNRAAAANSSGHRQIDSDQHIQMMMTNGQNRKALVGSRQDSTVSAAMNVSSSLHMAATDTQHSLALL